MYCTMCIYRFVFTVTLPLDATAFRNQKANVISAVFSVPDSWRLCYILILLNSREVSLILCKLYTESR